MYKEVCRGQVTMVSAGLSHEPKCNNPSFYIKKNLSMLMKTFPLVLLQQCYSKKCVDIGDLTSTRSFLVFLHISDVALDLTMVL